MAPSRNPATTDPSDELTVAGHLLAHTAATTPVDTMTPTIPPDELLAALDQFINTIHWLRSRIRYTAADALAEALTESTIDAAAEEPPTPDDLTAALTAFTATLPSGPPDAAPAALTEALMAWTAAVSAEHHQSRPFQHHPCEATVLEPTADTGPG